MQHRRSNAAYVVRTSSNSLLYCFDIFDSGLGFSAYCMKVQFGTNEHSRIFVCPAGALK